MRNVDTQNAAAIRDQLEAGDRVTITTTQDIEYELEIVALTDVAIVAQARDGQMVTIPYEDVITAEVREPRPGRTAAVVGGTIGGVALLYAIATVAALAAILGGGG